MKKFNLFIFILVQTVFLSSTLAYADEISVKNSGLSASSELLNIDTKNEATTDKNNSSDLTQSNATVSEQAPEVNSEINANTSKREATADPQAEKAKKAAIEQEKKIKYKKAIVSFIKSKNPKLSDAATTKAAEAAMAASEKHGVDVNIILAIMWKESYFTSNAKGASCYGIMQVNKSTGAGFGYSSKDLMDPYKNADVATQLLKGQIKKFGGTTMGLTAYNAGGGNVSKGKYTTKYANTVLSKSKSVKSYIDSYMKK